MVGAQAQNYLAYIGANVCRCRGRLDLTQEELAERTGFDARFVQRIERGRVNLSIESLVRLADALHVKPGHLLRSTKIPVARQGRPPKRRSAGKHASVKR